MTTATKAATVQQVLDDANPQNVADALRMMKLGTILTPLKRTFTGLTAAASFDLTEIDGTGETTGDSNPNRLAALCINTLRVTAVGTGSTGTRFVSDTGGTASSTVVKISDDGKTVTFEGTVTAFVIQYIPRPQVAMTDLFARI